MTSRDFVYWFQGFLEIGDPLQISSAQLDVIKRHLAMVFVHEIDPSMGDKKHQDLLDHIHTAHGDGAGIHTNPVGDTVKFRC